MTKIFKLVLFIGLLLGTLAHADAQQDKKNNIFLSYCGNFEAGVSFSFQSCVNTNFSTIGQSLGGYFSYCLNYGDQVSFGFTSCVNSGFSESQRLLDNNIELQYCTNFSQNTLDFSFISCVNSNFIQIENEINNRDE